MSAPEDPQPLVDSPEPASAAAATDSWEVWAKVAVALAGVMTVAWLLVYMRLGITSVQIHAMAIPTFGALTLAVGAWGLWRTLIRPPVMRRSRTIAFGLLLVVGYLGNVPMFAPPLATEDYVSAQTWSLPVRGGWTTLAGGRDHDHNYHATTAAIRWAYDFTRVVDGKKFALDGKKAADWHCFGEPVYAPVSGKVVRAVSRYVDNNPGEISPDSLFGNYVVIEAAPGEYAFIAHMQKGSVTVEAGQMVERGAEIGKCGNSGRSPEPHVHMHVQDRVDFPLAQGLPIEFTDYVANGKPVARGMPRGASSWDATDGDLLD